MERMNDAPAATIPAVGLNAHLLSLADTYRSAGIHGYISQLLRLLPDAAPDFRFTAYLHDRRFTPPWNEKTEPLTDDFAPVEYLKAVERHNAKQT